MGEGEEEEDWSEAKEELVADRYGLIRRFGESAVGVSWKALDIKTDKKVLLKKLEPPAGSESDLAEYFERQAENMLELEHPNVERLLAALQEPPWLVLVFEFLRGRTMEQILKQKRRMPLRQAMQVIRAACAGVQYMHEHTIVHRGLKPSKIMLTHQGRIKVLGFGVPGEAGVLGYMPPSETEGKPTVVSDVYSLGVCLYEMVVGASPFTTLEGSERGYIPAAPIVEGIPPQFDELIQSILQIDVYSRLQSAKELSDALKNFGAPPTSTDLAG